LRSLTTVRVSRRGYFGTLRRGPGRRVAGAQQTSLIPCSFSQSAPSYVLRLHMCPFWPICTKESIRADLLTAIPSALIELAAAPLAFRRGSSLCSAPACRRPFANSGGRRGRARQKAPVTPAASGPPLRRHAGTSRPPAPCRGVPQVVKEPRFRWRTEWLRPTP